MSTHTLPATQRAWPAAQDRVAIIGIGVQKAATSWLFRCLAEHPAIRITRVHDGTSDKELNFFNHHYERGYGWYHRGFQFGPWKNMEFSTLYFHDCNVPERILRYNPDARLVLCLRNPVDRALSHHKHEIRRGRVPPDRYDFWDAVEYNPSYIEQGNYASHLERWLECFVFEQIHMVDYEDVCRTPADVMRGVLSFLRLDSSFRPTVLQRRINEALVPRSVALDRWTRWCSRTARGMFGDRLVRFVGKSGIPTAVRRRNRILIDERWLPPVSQATRARLAAEFAVENRRLSRLWGRDLSHWA